MLWWPFWSIFVHFGAHHGWPHHPSMTGFDSYPLSSVHLIQKWLISETQDKFKTLLLCHAMLKIWINFGSFWSILGHLMGDPTTPLWRVLTPIPFQAFIQSRNGWYLSLSTYLKKLFLVMLWWPFGSILVHFGAPHGRPHNPSSSYFHQVIEDMYPMHQELLNATSPTILAQFIQEILI